jgi:hypothetical protein
VRIPFTPSIRNVGGGLHWRQPLSVPICKAPANFQAPNALENGAYCTTLESQGKNPWCAAYALCCILQASAWRHYGRPIQFDEAKAYAAAKQIDGIRGDGTTLEAVISVARTMDLCDGAVEIPTITAEYIEDAEDIYWGVHRFGLVLTGMAINEGWQYTRQNGWIGDAGRRLGGHATVTSGYYRGKHVRGPNSWGTAWGVRGHWVANEDQFRQQYLGGYGLEIVWK